MSTEEPVEGGRREGFVGLPIALRCNEVRAPWQRRVCVHHLTRVLLGASPLCATIAPLPLLQRWCGAHLRQRH